MFQKKNSYIAALIFVVKPRKHAFVLFFSTNPGNLLHDDTIRAGGQKEGADSYCCHWRPEKGRSMILSNYTTLVLLHLHYYHKYDGFIRKTLKDFFVLLIENPLVHC